MDIKPYGYSNPSNQVNYSFLEGVGSSAANKYDVQPVFPYEMVPGFINGSGLWNGSDGFNLYDTSSISPNGTNGTNITCDGNSTCVTSIDSGLPLWQVVFFGILSVATIVVTILGNLIVILSFFLDRQIRQPTNYFIASLAMSDLLIGSMSMPFYTLYLLAGQKWLLGINMCDLWLSVDYTVCLTSIYTVFAITIDRFCSVKIPAKYRNWRTERKVIIIIAATWIIPSLVFFISIFGMPYFVGERTVPDDMCYVQYLSQAIFNCILQVSYFWITLLVMCILYTGIYKVALDLQRRSNAKKSKMTSLVSMAGQTMTRIGIGMSQQAAVDAQKLFTQAESTCISNAESMQTPQPKKTSKHMENKANNNHGTSGATLKNPQKEDDRSSSPAFPSDTDPSSQSPKPEHNDSSSKSHIKHRKSRSSADRDKEVKPFKLQKPPKGKRSHRSGQKASPARDENCINPAGSNNIGGRLASMGNIYMPNHTAAQSCPESERKGNRECDALIPLPTTENEKDEPVVDGGRDELEEEEADTVPELASPQTVTGSVGLPPELLAGVRYIDQESLKSLQSNDNLRSLAEAAKALTNCQEKMSPTDPLLQEPDSPIWKMRGSVVVKTTSSPNSSVNASPQPHDQTKLTVTPRTEPVTPGFPSTPGVDSPEASIVFSPTPSPNCYPTAELTVETRGNHSRPVTQIAKHSDTDSVHDKGSRRSKGSGRGSPLSSLVKTVKRSKRGRTKGKEKQKQSRSENRARKALRVITIILGAFVLCWTPWHVLSLIIGFMDPKDQGVVLLKLYDISYWLCYLNSPINPFCYAFANAQFKKAFIRILKFDWHRS